MEVIIQPNEEIAILLAARYMAHWVREKPDLVLGLATGGTPVKLYRELVRLHREEGLDFAHVRTFNLDAYLGLPATHPCSYRRFMVENLFAHVNIRPENVHIPNGMTEDVHGECERYEERIREVGGIDLQLLGIGGNGHIGFNEPGSSLGARTRNKTLTPRTRIDNSRFFGSLDEVPLHCITMGCGTILDSRRIMLLAFGASKAGVVAKFIEGPITAMVPGSILQLHRSTKAFLDEASAADLEMQDYYRWVYEHKPLWEQLREGLKRPAKA